MFTKLFGKRLTEESTVAFLGAFGAVFLADGGFTKAAFVAGVLAGVRAVYGLAVKNIGEDKDKPSVS